MSKWKRTTLIVAAACVAVGAVIVIGALAAAHGDWRKLNTSSAKYEQVTTEVSEAFTNLDISVISDDVRLLPAPDGACRVVAWDSEEVYHIVDVQDDTLRIRMNQDGHEWSFWSIDFGPTAPDMGTLTLYLPESAYERVQIETVSGEIDMPSDFAVLSAALTTVSGTVRVSAAVEAGLTIQTTSGDARVQNITGGDVQISTTSGDVSLAGIRAERLELESTSGEIELRDAAASGEARIETVSGEIDLDGFDAETIRIETISGDVEGSIRTPKRYEVSTTSGDVRVPDSDPNGGLCEVHTTSGDVELQ